LAERSRTSRREANFQLSKRPSTPAKERKHQLIVPPRSGNLPQREQGEFSKEELKLMFPNAFGGKLGCAKGVQNPS